jgi:very-short-patch-repair endonuclease
MEEFLYDFKFKASFDVDSSLFHQGNLRHGTSRITLREHFRCMPEIIRYSNNLCYRDTPLIPLRQYGPDRLMPLERVFVKGGYREGTGSHAINRPEAEAIVEKVISLCADTRYTKKSIGVVVMQGEAQAGLIESQLLERLGAEEMELRRLICGNPYSFQGDERDIMLISLITDGSTKEGPTDEKRYNVAMSRARDQVWLFHSVTCNDLSNTYLRRGLLEFFEGQGTSAKGDSVDWERLESLAFRVNRSQEDPPVPFHQPGIVKGSWFEVDVALEIHRKGYHVIPQFPFAGRHIDLVVEGGIARLAVECDGDHCHGLDNWDRDMQRQRQLQRCGWEFFRVRESVFYANKVAALEGLWRALEARDIFPVSLRPTSSPEVGMDDDEICREFNNDATFREDYSDDDDDDDDDDGGGGNRLSNYEEPLLPGLDGDTTPFGRRTEDLTPKEIEDAILQALAKCPNQTCTLHSLTSRVLKEVGVLTRGNPRIEFEKRVLRSLVRLEKRNAVEQYRAKNKRVRLV